ncbi:MAG: DUF1795 domain-containing protein [Actinomycetota bacterium]|nr:DUF1795 domain-containing protein [Actinomycetota bacterium]
MNPAALALPLLAAALVAGCGGGDSGAPTELPAGWADGEGAQREAIEDYAEQLGEAAGSEVELEAFYVDEDTAGSGFATNVNVLAEKFGDEVDAAGYQEQSIGSLETVGVTNAKEAPGTEVGGESARVVEYSSPAGAEQVKLRLAVAVHDGTGYNFTLASSAAGYDEAVADFEEILANWEWSD